MLSRFPILALAASLAVCAGFGTFPPNSGVDAFKCEDTSDEVVVATAGSTCAALAAEDKCAMAMMTKHCPASRGIRSCMPERMTYNSGTTRKCYEYDESGQLSDARVDDEVWKPATCQHENDGDCDDGGPGSEYSLCARGSDCNDCQPKSTPGIEDPDNNIMDMPPGGSPEGIEAIIEMMNNAGGYHAYGDGPCDRNALGNLCDGR